MNQKAFRRKKSLSCSSPKIELGESLYEKENYESFGLNDFKLTK